MGIGESLGEKIIGKIPFGSVREMGFSALRLANTKLDIEHHKNAQLQKQRSIDEAIERGNARAWGKREEVITRKQELRNQIIDYCNGHEADILTEEDRLDMKISLKYRHPSIRVERLDLAPEQLALIDNHFGLGLSEEMQI